MKLYADDFQEKHKWDCDAINRPLRLELPDSESEMNTLGHSNTCQMAMSVGLGTINGLIAKDTMSDQKESLALGNRYHFRRSPDAPSGALLSQNQAVYMLERLLEAGTYYKKNEKFHGDYCPNNITYDYNGEIRVLDTRLFTTKSSGYVKMLDDKEYRTSLSPELLKCYSIQRSIHPIIDLERSDVFSIAISIVSAAHGESFDQYYDYNSCKINFNKLYERMNALIYDSNGYEEEFGELIVQMLNELPNKRPTFEEASDKLNSFGFNQGKLVIEKY